MAKLLLALIALYQATLSRLILAVVGPVCRFTPSCSRYAAACISSHGALRGSLLSVRRLCKCHPFHPGGFDPPPAPPHRPHQGRPAPFDTTSSPAASARPSTPPPASDP
ncbi:MAG: membrane protein insertion efficiency factor YidD [Polyangiaceae bacterium]